MRTTLTIDDDVLAAARALAERENRSIGQVISELARRALQREQPPARRNGIVLLPLREPGTIVTPEAVNRLRDEGQ
jgi:hypothetical protein